jgi:hypothetical protein
VLVWIVYVPDAEKRGPDLSRMNRVEEVPDELGRMMIGDGSARAVTDEERADFEATREAAEAAASGDLAKRPKADLLKLAEEGDVEVPPHATKADIAAALQERYDQVRADTVDVPLPDDAGTEDAPAAEQGSE